MRRLWRFAEIRLDGVDHRFADLIQRIHLGDGFLVALGYFQARFVESGPRAVAARQRDRRCFAHVPDAERVDEPLQRDLTPRFDRSEQIAHRGLAVTLLLLELDLAIALGQFENVGRLLDPPAFEKEFDLLFAESLDVESAARHEMLQVLHFLIGTSKFTGAM